MSNRTSGIVIFDCGFDHGQTESCHGKHEAEIILHNTSDTVTIRVDDKTMCVTDDGFSALETCLERLRASL